MRRCIQTDTQHGHPPAMRMLYGRMAPKRSNVHHLKLSNSPTLSENIKAIDAYRSMAKEMATAEHEYSATLKEIATKYTGYVQCGISLLIFGCKNKLQKHRVNKRWKPTRLSLVVSITTSHNSSASSSASSAASPSPTKTLIRYALQMCMMSSKCVPAPAAAV